jgi:hypothetical protein
MISDTLFEAAEEVRNSLEVYDYAMVLTPSQIYRVRQALRLLDEVRSELDTPPQSQIN